MNIEMKFDAIVGNPPYQILDGGAQASAKPVYNLFVEFAKLLNPNFISFIMPSRWMTGGKGLDEFREKMINDKRFLILHDYFNSKDCFPNVDIKGGVCYFLWNNKIKSECEVFTHLSGESHSSKRYLKEKKFDFYIRDNRMISVLHKITNVTTTFFDTIVSTRKPYGLSGDFFKDPSKYGLPAISNYPIEGGYKILGLEENKRIFKYISQNYPLPKNDMLNKYKVFVSESYGIGSFGEEIQAPFLAAPGELCTETFLQIGPFNNRNSAGNLIKYIQTKLFRCLVGILKITQHATKKVYAFVPIQDFTTNSDIDWTKPIADIDNQLYLKYDLSQNEKNFIESVIKSIK